MQINHPSFNFHLNSIQFFINAWNINLCKPLKLVGILTIFRFSPPTSVRNSHWEVRNLVKYSKEIFKS